MKFPFFLFLILIGKIILIEENKTKTNNKKEKNNKTEETEKYDENKGFFSPDKIHDLNDLFFDSFIREGKIYRWFILFYSKTCGHCRRAKKEIQKLFNDLKHDDKIRFAQMEAYDNTMTNVRFNITGVPYIILVENNSMYELDLFPNYDNLKNFVFTNFSKVKEDLKPLPIKVKFHYVAWIIFKQTVESIGNSFNNFINRKGINRRFNPFTILITFILAIILCCFGMIKCCIYCCCNDDDIAKELKLLEEQYKLEMEQRKQSGAGGVGGDEGEGEEIEGEEGYYEEGEEEEDDEGEENEKKKELTEEEKKKLEEEKKILEEKKKEEERKKKEEEEKKKQEEEKRKKEKETTKENQKKKKQKKKKE